MDSKLFRIYYSPKGYWKGLAAVKKKTSFYSQGWRGDGKKMAR